MSNVKVIDYLFEDPQIPSQKFALVSIVGPHMKQKCDVWGLKVRGTAESLEKAKAMTQKLMRIDNNYDIYTVEVGKFFPLAVEPHKIENVEYQNTQLNELVRSYLENRELANEQWETRKNEMIKEAIREGKNQQELQSKPEHPIAVLQRMKSFEQKITELTEVLEATKEDLKLSQEKFESYSEEQRMEANKDIQSAIDANLTQNDKDASIDDIRKQLLEELSVDQIASSSTSSSSNTDVEQYLKEIKACEEELAELEEFKSSLSPQQSPNVFKRTSESISTLQKQRDALKAKLTNSELVNSYINTNYQSSEFEYFNTAQPSKPQN
jgi:hypothetical protein